MNLVIPMAGMGKRMRPHTLTVPKPLIPLAGKSIVQHLVEDIARVCAEPIENIAFVTGRFGKAVEENLLNIAGSTGAKGSIVYQDEPLGTAHAILCAKELLRGKTIVAFADTLFSANFTLDDSSDGVLWVHQIEDPSAFGVVTVNDQNVITDFVEKPKTFVSDLAMIGIYYFKDGANLARELQYLIDNEVIKGGEYQLPDALKNMTEKGVKFKPGAVSEWLDCGNKDATVYTNQRVLELKGANTAERKEVKITNSTIVEPCFIAEGVEIANSVVGPHVSIGKNSKIESSVVKNSILQENSTVAHCVVHNSMLGNEAALKGRPAVVSLGDYSTIS